MYRIVLIVACSSVLALAAEDDCKQLAHPKYMRCCKTPPPIKEEEREDMKECFKLMRKPPSCEAAVCLAKKQGYAANEDGKFDKEKLANTLQVSHSEDPVLLKNVMDKCVNGDLTAYGPPDFCDLIKLKHCISMQILLGCSDFEIDGKCSGVKDLVDKCKV
ncbi:uncharacterized protein LOC126368504 [Pectinophora gossypiella]|uniref:uncharacterized protein LOC126368504 n=1 Tax=Pectinophora gossypiella TaxID=13191 RepID=UPI00214ECA5A|nr:uncharacterized protein LOC126368504 [Pectinophora gossypiella]